MVEVFPGGEIRRLEPVVSGESLDYQVRFPLPESLAEARTNLDRMRRGLAGLIARFEPDRFRSLEPLVETFGARETLAGLRVHEPRIRAVRVASSFAGSVAIH